MGIGNGLRSWSSIWDKPNLVKACAAIPPLRRCIPPGRGDMSTLCHKAHTFTMPAILISLLICRLSVDSASDVFLCRKWSCRHAKCGLRRTNYPLDGSVYHVRSLIGQHVSTCGQMHMSGAWNSGGEVARVRRWCQDI